MNGSSFQGLSPKVVSSGPVENFELGGSENAPIGFWNIGQIIRVRVPLF
jgi:hypothetical protein